MRWLGTQIPSAEAVAFETAPPLKKNKNKLISLKLNQVSHWHVT